MTMSNTALLTSAPSLFRDYRVHHSTADGILVQLPDAAGFGRVTVATLGNDALAHRLFKAFSAREHLSAMPMRKRDAQGYRLLTVDLKEGYSALHTYPTPVQRLVYRLLRKHMMVGLGTTTAARLMRSSAKGSVLMLSPQLTAVATLEDLNSNAFSAPAFSAAGAASTPRAPDGDDDAEEEEEGEHPHAESAPGKLRGTGGTVEVRLLSYDVDADVVNVTAKPEVVEGTPLDTAVSAAALATVHAGDVVSCTVLLSSTDDGCAVVQIPVPSVKVDRDDSTSRCVTVLGYYLYDWEGHGKAEAAPIVGHQLELVVEFSPEAAALFSIVPFVILSDRVSSFHHLPAVRYIDVATAASLSASSSKAAAATRGLLGYFPWRSDAQTKGRRTEESEDDDDVADGEGGQEAAKDRLQRTRRRRLEEALDAYERGMEKAVPTSPEEFRRLLLANPNSSYIWTQYMAHHVGLQQYEAARQVAEKALSTVGVREQEELLNIWVAYLNVENMYGTEESLSAVFRRAQQRQLKQLPLFERLADIFAASRKPNQLLALCRTMTSKFRTERRTWERLGVVLVDQGKRDQLKRMLKDMGDVLKRDDATVAIVHIAIHEYKHGSPENGRALFEGLLRKVPKRSDVWSAYIDQEMGLLNRKEVVASVLQVRLVFQRAVAMTFTAKVMQQLLTRFLAFEKLHGTPADVEAVKERARTYVEAKIQAVTDPGATAATL